MRRAFAAIVVTVFGLWLVLAFKSSPAKPIAATVTSTASTPTTEARGATGGTTPPTTGAPPPSTSGSGGRTVDGPTVSMQFGDVQVEVMLQGTHIVDVKALQLPYDRARSQYISEQVAPILHDEVLSAQNAQIDTVSGATYTSEAYAQSLQAALDQARA